MAQKYFFRNAKLRHLRIEQCVRYFTTSSGAAKSRETEENTAVMDDDHVFDMDATHRHYDEFCEHVAWGMKFQNVAKGLETLSRRNQGRLADSRLPYLEPIGQRREEYYEQKLQLTVLC